MRDTGRRFELDVDGGVVFANYRRDDDTISILHVESPPELRGKGAAGKLMEAIIEHAKSKHLKVVPICSYAAAWMKRQRII